MIDFEHNNIFYYFKMYEEDWGQFIVIDHNKDNDVSTKELYYYYVNPYSCLYTFIDETYYENLRKPIIIDNCLCFEEMISLCFKNLLCGNH